MPIKARERIGGVTLSRAEKRLIDRARKVGDKTFSRAEYMRDAALDRARRELAPAESDQREAVNQ